MKLVTFKSAASGVFTVALSLLRLNVCDMYSLKQQLLLMQLAWPQRGRPFQILKYGEKM